MSEWVEFNAPLDTIQVISEAEIHDDDDDDHCMTFTAEHLKCIAAVCILCLEQNCMDVMRRIVTIVHTETNNSMEVAFYYQSISQ